MRYFIFIDYLIFEYIQNINFFFFIMLFALFAIFTYSLDICVSSNSNTFCPAGFFTLSSFEKINDILENTNIKNVKENHLNIYIDNTYKNPIFLNLDEFEKNSLTATLIGNKESSFAVIDFSGRSYDDKSVFSYNGVTIHPKNTKGLSVGCVYTKNVDFQFPGFDSGKIFSEHLGRSNKKILPKSIISYDKDGDYSVFEFPLLPQFTHALITENSIILQIHGQTGTMTIAGLHKGTAFLNQIPSVQYPPLTIYTNITSDANDLPFFCLKIIKATNITISEFPKQPSGIPPIGFDVQTTDEININGASATKSKFVLFDTEPLTKKSLNVNHADVYFHHYGNDKKDQISFLFSNLSLNYGSASKISKSTVSVEADQVQSTGYSIRQIDEFKSYDNKKFQKVSLSQGMNYLKLTDQSFSISDGPDGTPKFQVNSDPNLNVLVLQEESSSTSLTIDTQSSTQSLNNLPNIELLLSKKSTLNIVSNLQINQNPHFQIFGDNLGKPVTIQSSNNNGFTFGLTDDVNGDFIVDGAKIELQDVEIVNVGQLTIKNTEYVKMNQNSNPIVSIDNLFVNADFISQIPNLLVISNFHILGDVKSQIIPCQKGPNVFVDIPSDFNTVEINSPNILFMNSNHQKTVTFSSISNNGHIYFAQKSSSPKSYSINLVYSPGQEAEKSIFGNAIFEFIDDASVNFAGDSWAKYTNENSTLVELRSSHRLSVNLNGLIPAKIVNNKGGELTINPSGSTFGFVELQLSGNTIISHNEKISVYLKTFMVDSTATFQNDKEIEINTEGIAFELAVFNILKNSKMKIVSELTSVSLYGNTGLQTDFTLNYVSERTKQFNLIGQTTSCSLSIENSVINYQRNDHTLIFKNFDNTVEIALSSQDLNTETEIKSLQLNAHSTFVFDNRVVLKGVVEMGYNSVIYARNNGKMVFSPIHDFITYFNLTNQLFPSIYSEKTSFEGKPYALSYFHPDGKEKGSKFINWVGYPLRTVCFPNFDCNSFISCVDVEHPFKDNDYSFKPVCSNYENMKCVSFNISLELYVPTPTRLPMPTQRPDQTRTKVPTDAPSATDSGDVEPDDSKSRKKNKAGMIAGIVIAILVVCVLIGVLVWWLRRRASNGGFTSFDPSLKERLTENAML